MVTITINGRSFNPTIIRNTISTDFTLDQEKHVFIDFYFEENGKTHFVRQETKYDEKEDTYVIDETVPAQWFTEE